MHTRTAFVGFALAAIAGCSLVVDPKQGAARGHGDVLCPASDSRALCLCEPEGPDSASGAETLRYCFGGAGAANSIAAEDSRDPDLTFLDTVRSKSDYLILDNLLNVGTVDATELMPSCRAAGALTVELVVRQGQLFNDCESPCGPHRLVEFSVPSAPEILLLGAGLLGDSPSCSEPGSRTVIRSNAVCERTDRELHELEPDRLVHIVLTVDGGAVQMWMNGTEVNSLGNRPLALVVPDVSTWSVGTVISFGNTASTATEPIGQRAWLGYAYFLGLYCYAMEPAEAVARGLVIDEARI